MQGQPTQWLPDVFVRGAWGEHAIVNNDFNGGPICAAQSTPMFKFLTTLVTVSASFSNHFSKSKLPVYAISLRAGLTKLKSTHEQTK